MQQANDGLLAGRRPSNESVDVDDLIALLIQQGEIDDVNAKEDSIVIGGDDSIIIPPDDGLVVATPASVSTTNTTAASTEEFSDEPNHNNDNNHKSSKKESDAIKDLRVSQLRMQRDMQIMEQQMVRVLQASIRQNRNRMNSSSTTGGRVRLAGGRRMNASRSRGTGGAGGGISEDEMAAILMPEAPRVDHEAQLRELGFGGGHGSSSHPDVEDQDLTDNSASERSDRMRSRGQGSLRHMSSFFDLFGGGGGASDDDCSQRSSSRNFRKQMRSLFTNQITIDEEDEDDLMESLPEDSFSVLKVSSLHSVAFWAAILVYFVQVGCFLLLLFNLTENSNDDGNPLDIPANVTPAVRVTQVILLTIAVLSQDATRTGIALIYKGYTPAMKEAFPNLSWWKFYGAVFLRIAEGSLGVGVTFLLIFDSEVVIDLLLNFTAMEFISQLDEIFFGLAAQGFVGNRLKKAALKVKETKFLAATVLKDPNDPSQGRERRGVRLHLILIATWLVMMVFWVVLTVNQSNGVYLCQSFQVQFEDDFVSSLGAFSGIYDIDSTLSLPFSSSRVRYIDRASGKAVFAYCEKLQAWSFAFAEDGHFPDPCVDWVAHSDTSETFDILETTDHEWRVRNMQDQEITIKHFHLDCMDCDRREDFAGECQGHGTCRTSDAVCVCEEDRLGSRCEFEPACPILEMDVRFAGFEDEREWSREFEIFEVDGETVYAYNLPVYVHEYKPGHFDLIVFTGRRWMATHTDVLLTAGLVGIEDPQERRRKLANYFTDHFHAYWSDFVASFMTEPMDIGTEQDAATPVELQWYTAKPKNALHPHEVQYVDRSVAPLDSVLLCELCDHEFNVCLNDGHCNANRRCDCLIGSSGSLCQIPPTGNGRCDPKFDIPKYNYDGGDCCESTCINGDIYHCGKDVTGFVDVGYFFCIHEEDEWHLNRASIDGLGAETRYSVALSSDGHILTLGEPNSGRVTLFDTEGSEWIQRGRVLEGPLGSFFGAHVAMSQGLDKTVLNFLKVDPVRVAASGRLRKKGFVRVYECLSQGCSQSGQDIFFDGLLEQSRTVHDISKDGTILAFGGYNVTRNSTTVHFYHYEEDQNLWTYEGIPDLEFQGDAYALKLSGDFDTLAIRSSSIWESQGIDEFHRKFEATDSKAVFHLNTEIGKWEQVGHTIEHHIDGHGASSDPDDFHILETRHRLSEFLKGADPIAISGDGLVMAVGFPFSAYDPGVHVFELDQNIGEWVDRGPTITNNHHDGFKGWSVALSGDGSVVVVGTGGDDTATNTYIWDGQAWNLYGHEVAGGEQSSIAMSTDGSVLAVGHEHIIDVYHRNIKTKCKPDEEWFHLSLTLDSHPEDTRWDLVFNSTGEKLLSGGPYVGNPYAFPYHDAYERSTISVEACVPRGGCKVFSVYDKIDPLVDMFETPDGMLAPSVYDLQIDGIEIAKRRLDQACDHYYFGEDCQLCPEDTHAVKVLIRSCIPFHWDLKEATVGQVLVGDNGEDFAGSNFTYIRDGTCQHLGLEVHTYWEEACVKVADFEHDCFAFDLTAHKDYPVVISGPDDIEIEHAHRNTEVVLLFDDLQINVDLALIGSLNAGPPSEIHYKFGGACPEGDGTQKYGTHEDGTH